MPDRKEIFEDIFAHNRWRGGESVSGHGSHLVETVALRQQLPALISKLGIKTLLDAPCGDFNWMCQVDLPIRYIGLDIVPGLIQTNQERYPDREFLLGDIVTSELPRADIILCRDCLVHLPLEEAVTAILNFKKSGATYLALTSYPMKDVNRDFAEYHVVSAPTAAFQTGDWRPLNLELPPFNFPKPFAVINEEARAADTGKTIGIWRVKDL